MIETPVSTLNVRRTVSAHVRDLFPSRLSQMYVLAFIQVNPNNRLVGESLFESIRLYEEPMVSLGRQ